MCQVRNAYVGREHGTFGARMTFSLRLAAPERCRIWEGVEESVRLRRNIQKFRRLWRTRATESRVNYLVLP